MFFKVRWPTARFAEKVYTASGLNRTILKRAANELITPFSPFVLSDSFLSSEIENLQLAYLNPVSVNLRESGGSKTGRVVFVQVDELEEFSRRYLPTFQHPVTLITGKWQSPGLERSQAIDSILKSKQVVAWFSQNQVFSDYPIIPFPFGVSLWTAPAIIRAQNRGRGRKSSSIYIPHTRIHSHLTGQPRTVRESLIPIMDKFRSPRNYLRRIARHKFAVCPPGDRADTYRHWEALALGTVPICEKNEYYSRLFGDNVIQIHYSDLKAAKNLSECSSNFRPAPITTLDYWRRIVFAA